MAQNSGDHPDRVAAGESRSAGERAVSHNGESVNVDSLIKLISILELLGRHVSGSTGGIRLYVSPRECGYAEVQEFPRPLARQKQILRLYVLVDNAALLRDKQP